MTALTKFIIGSVISVFGSLPVYDTALNLEKKEQFQVYSKAAAVISVITEEGNEENCKEITCATVVF